MTAEIRNNNFTIGEFNRSDDRTIEQQLQQMYSGSFDFVETKFIHIKQLLIYTLYKL